MPRTKFITKDGEQKRTRALGGGVNFSVEIGGLNGTLTALRDAQPQLKKATMPVMRKMAQRVKAEAGARVTPHPSGLWRVPQYNGGETLFSSSYYMSKRGDFWYQVHNGTGWEGRAKQIIEFARRPHSTSGQNLIRGINQHYPRPSGGRILWAAYDDLQAELIEQFEQAVNEAAAAIEKEANTVG